MRFYVFAMLICFAAPLAAEQTQSMVSAEVLTKFETRTGSTVALKRAGPLFIWHETISGKAEGLMGHVDVDAMTVPEIHQFLRPGEPVPRAVTKAVAEVEQLGELYGERTDRRQPLFADRNQTLVYPADNDEPDPSEYDVDNQTDATATKDSGTWGTCSRENMKKLGACKTLDWRVRWFNLNGREWFSRNDTSYVQGALCTYKGDEVRWTTKYRIWFTWEYYDVVDVERGDIEKVFVSPSDLWDFDYFSLGHYANANGYHMCGAGLY